MTCRYRAIKAVTAARKVVFFPAPVCLLKVEFRLSATSSQAFEKGTILSGWERPRLSEHPLAISVGSAEKLSRVAQAFEIS